MMREWLARFAAMFRRRSLRERLEIELELHRALLAEDLAAAGSHSNARREMGAASFRDRYYDRAGIPWLEHLWSDIRYGLRGMRRSPAFSLAVILILALGIGGTTAIFSLVHGVLIKPLPYPGSERLVWLGEAAGPATGISVTWVNYKNWRAASRSFESMAAFQFAQLTLTGRSEPMLTRGLSVTAEYFGLLGMRPLLGRLFSVPDDRPGAAPTVVLNHGFWSGKLGGDPGILGSQLVLDGKPYEVVGVAAPLWEPLPVDYYLPLGMLAGATVDRSRHGSMRVLGRLKPGVTLESACADLDGILRRLAEADPGPESAHRSFGRFYAEHTSGVVRGTLLILLGAAALVLLIACANAAGLLLARGTMRISEFAVRAAIGAGRARLARQLLTEAVLIAALGGLSGLLLARLTLGLLIATAPQQIPRLAETSLDPTVLVFACAITLATGLLAGTAPAFAARKLDLAAALKESARSSAGAPRQYARSALVVAEVALTFVLVFGSGLLLRSLAAAQRAQSGVDTRSLLSLELLLPNSGYQSPEAIAGFYTRLAAGLRAIPGVAGVSSVRCPPGAGDCGDWFYSIPGRTAPARNEVPISLFNVAEAEYFRTMAIPIRAGRAFRETDRAAAPQVAIVNETFARTWWPGESPVGHQIKVGGPYIDGPLLEIVGVAGDVRQGGLDSQPLPEIYQPFSQRPSGAMAVMIRAAGDPEALIASVRSAVWGLDRNLPIRRLEALERTLSAGLARRRFSTALLTSFAGLAMVLAVAGIYGLLNYWVSVRRREIAIRIALGAHPWTLLRWAGAQALRLAAIGIALGGLSAWPAARVLESLVFGIPSRNPAVLAGAAFAVILLAVAAAAAPAARAARVDAAPRLQSS